MKVYNTTLNEFINYINSTGTPLYIYGVGEDYSSLVQKEFYKSIKDKIAGYIDNGKRRQKITVSGREFCVFGEDVLKSVTEGIILICSTNYLMEIYDSLCGLNLSDDFICFSMSFLWAFSDGRDDTNIKQQLMNAGQYLFKIEKKIHCFWFSGDKKPVEYQKCIDSWKRVCPEYEIVEWNAENYDCEKNIFLKQAYENRKWAFVSDYARLDVIYHYGGIYLDMDVELIKDFGPLLQFDAFFNFGMRFDIDLGSGFGSVKNNPFIGELLGLYQNKEFLDQHGKPMVKKYIQPEYIKDSFKQSGICMNGDMQMFNNMLVLPRKYYGPRDDVILGNHLECDDTRGIHHYNAGWCSAEVHEQRRKCALWMGVAQQMP